MKYLPLFLLGIIQATCTDFTSKPIRTMSFNIRYDNEGDGINKWENRKEFVLEVIQEFDPDLLGTQEAMKSQVDFLSNSLSNYYSIGTNNCDCREQYDSLLLVKKSRYKIIDEKHFWLSKTPNVAYSENFNRSAGHSGYGPRTMSCVELLDKLDNYTLFFCNTHWDGNVLWNEQAAALTKQLFMEYGKKINILMGDFNEFPFSYEAWPQSPDWIRERHSKAYDILTSFLIDGFKQLHPNNTQSSGCGWDPECPEWEDDFRIDWILHSENVQIEDAQILIKRKNGLNISDHFPVVSILNVY